jgi:hypothetical protein
MCYLEVVIFISVRFGFYKKKITKTDFFLKKKLKPVQTDRFRFGLVILGTKPVWLGFPVWIGFFPAWLGFFPV